MPSFIDLTGKTYGRWLVLNIALKKENTNEIRWLCKCSCGKEKIILGSSLRRGNSKSCGCSKIENNNKKRIIVDGKTFGKLVVVKKHLSTRNGYSYLCKCSCGNTKVIMGSSLRSGATKSCGCLRKELNEDTPLNILISHMRAAAKHRKYNWELTNTQVKEIIQQPCFYCGVPPMQGVFVKELRGYTYNGIDRVNNTRGYVADNCVPCCKTCNIAKNNLSYMVFKTWVLRTASHIAQHNASALLESGFIGKDDF